MAAQRALIDELLAALAAAADPALAPAMQAYMKSALPFLGLATPQRRRVVAETAARHAITDAPMLADTALALWRQATHREQRYAALDLLRLARSQKLIGPTLLPALIEMLRTGPWWDHNDEISGHALGLLLLREPATLKPLLRRWASGDDLWLRRAAMLCQRSIKGAAFDAVLLYDCLLPSVGNAPLAREFFIRKGMGWALRERSYAAPDEVQAFCDAYRDRLSPLTLREALEVLSKRAGATAAVTASASASASASAAPRTRSF